MGMTQLEMDVARSTIRMNKAVAKSLETIDWEQRRYEIAKDILPYCAETARDLLMAGQSISSEMTVSEAMAKQAVSLADALIKELK